MGTVTAIGEYDPNRPPNYIYSPATTTTAVSTFLWQPQVDFDTWREAVDFAAILAIAVMGKVRVRKDGPTWTVSWSAAQSTPTYPLPYVQPYQPPYPYTVSWDGGLGTIQKGDTA